MFGVRRRRNLEKLARLRAGELPDEPAFWMDARGNDGPGETASGVESPPHIEDHD
jgi:hypothetical protein